MSAPDYSQAAPSIWAYANGVWRYDGAAGVPYTRTDLSQASVAAALEAAAGIAYKAWDGEPEDGEAVRSEIRALITPAQRTALQAAIDAAKAEARAEDAAKIAQLEQDLADANSGADDAYRRGYWAGGNGA